MTATQTLDTSHIPSCPGVYLMKGDDSIILYIGKAKVLSARVGSYLQKNVTWKTRMMMSNVRSIDFIATTSELEALLLENTLIKKHKPKYNIMLKDDKTYPYLKVTLKEKYPRLVVVRRITRDGSRYFGPYHPASALKDTLKTVSRHFGLAMCKSRLATGTRPCVLYQVGRCSGVCAGLQSEEEYKKRVDELVLFLEGKSSELIKSLEIEMKTRSAAMEFELAAITRDRLFNIKLMMERQKTVSSRIEDKDVIGVCENNGKVFIEILFIRGGKLTGKRSIEAQEGSGKMQEEPMLSEVVSCVIKQFYAKDVVIPSRVVIPVKIEDTELIEKWLSGKKGKAVSLGVPSRGDNLHLLKMAQENSRLSLEAASRTQENIEAVLISLRDLLGLKTVPRRIEVFDISNISGDMAVGSMIVHGSQGFQKRDYKKFRIRTVQQSDDFGMMKEVVSRHYLKAETIPDLIVIDGGAGQLGAAISALGEAGRHGIEIIALAKEKNGRFERVFIPGAAKPFVLPKRHQATFLLQRVRNEAHRFAISYHKNLRKSKGRLSVLDDIKGIGEKRKKNLIRHFGSAKRAMQASIDELASVPGVTRRLAERLHSHLDCVDKKTPSSLD